MRNYPEISGPPRSYLAPLLAFLTVGAAAFAGYWWYLQGLEEDCRQQCLAKGHKNYRYVESTTHGKRLRPGSCSCIE